MQQGLINHLQVQGLSDDFLKVHGNDAIMYSRVTEISKTRIDYIFSNTGSCVYFQYLAVQGLDHRVALGKYDVPVRMKKEHIPADRYFDGWVISKYLETDEEFLEQAKYMMEIVHAELKKKEQDPSFLWLKAKTSLIRLAKSREKEIRIESESRMKVLKEFYSSILNEIQKGYDKSNELSEVKKEMNNIYKVNAKEKIDKMRCIQIDEHTYDIHKLRNQKKV